MRDTYLLARQLSHLPFHKNEKSSCRRWLCFHLQVWLQYQCLWDMQAENIYGGWEDLSRWQRCWSRSGRPGDRQCRDQERIWAGCGHGSGKGEPRLPPGGTARQHLTPGKLQCEPPPLQVQSGGRHEVRLLAQGGTQQIWADAGSNMSGVSTPDLQGEAGPRQGQQATGPLGSRLAAMLSAHSPARSWSSTPVGHGQHLRRSDLHHLRAVPRNGSSSLRKQESVSSLFAVSWGSRGVSVGTPWSVLVKGWTPVSWVAAF